MSTGKTSNSPGPAEMTLVTFQADYPELYAEVARMGRAAGEQAAIERLEAISKLAPDDPAFIVEQFGKGATLDQAKDARIAKLAEALAKKPTETQPKTDPALQEFAAEQSRPVGTAKPEGAAAA